jgi:hypothetical protein
VDQVQFDIFQDIHKVHQYQVLSQFEQAIQLFKITKYEKKKKLSNKLDHNCHGHEKMVLYEKSY